jgi:hypothetical protein
LTTTLARGGTQASLSTTAKADAHLGLVLAGRYHAAMPRCLPTAVALILALAPAAAAGAEAIPGPINARVVRVIDGEKPLGIGNLDEFYLP